MPVFKSLAMLLVWLCLATAAHAQNGETTAPIAAGEDIPADTVIDRRIETILQEIDGMDDVFATVRSGVVTLRGKVPEAALAVQAEQLASRVEGVVAVRNNIEEITSVSERIVPAWERLTTRVMQFIHYVPLLALAAAIFLVIALAGGWIASLSWPWSQIAPNSFIAHLLQQVVRLLFAGLGMVVALDILGATALLGTILGAAGIVGLAVGFAVRDTVENYIASILLSIRQPFRPNDWVEIGGEEGSVVMLTSRATILFDAGGNHIRIPNSTVYKGVVRNYTRNPERRLSFVLGVDPEANLREAMDVGLGVIGDLEFVLNEPEPAAWIVDIGDSSVTITFTAWVNQTETSFLQARSEAIRLVKLALEKQGIALPEPTYRVIIEGEEAKAPARKKPAAKRRAVPEPDGETDVPGDTSVDDTITRKVEEERSRSDSNDLLDDDAPQEIG